MKRAFTTTAALVATAAAATAHAGVIVTVTDLGAANATIGGTPRSFGDLRAYKLTAASDDANLIAGFDFGGTANNPRGIFGAAGTLLQRGSVDPDTGETTLTPVNPTLNGSTTVNSFDSHWLIANASRVDAAAPSEDNDFANLAGGPADTGTSDYGGGSFLKGVFGLTLAARASSVDFAYLVLPAGASATFSGLVSTSAAGAPAFAVTGVVPVPEPAAVGLAAASCLGLLARRRRRTA